MPLVVIWGPVIVINFSRFLNFIKERLMSRGQDKGKKKLSIKEKQDRKKEKLKNKMTEEKTEE